jgi:hypothetical protein
MDEIGQDPKLNVRFPRGRWLDATLVRLQVGTPHATGASANQRPRA